MRNFTGKKLFLTVMSASCTLRGFAQDARGAINDVLDSFTLPVFGGFYAWRYHSGSYPAMGQYHRQGKQGHAKGSDSSHWAGMSVLHCWPQSWCPP